MARLIDLIIIRLNVRAWNLWQQVVLRRADFSGADLRGANLERADLSRAYLRGANLRWADLRGAYLGEANLSGTNLSNADLRGAYLREAKLSAANLSWAKLGGTNLSNAKLEETILGNVDLSETNGLANCNHTGRSMVDNRTLERSKNVPINFWQGCGLADWQIEATKLYQEGLTQDDVITITYEIARIRGDQPIQLFSPFISYSSRDEEFAKRLYNGLQSHGVRCWYAPEDMKIGDRIRSRIDDVIHIHDKLLLVLSEHSVASQWVEQEVETALAKERETGEAMLFPIKVDTAVDTMKAGWPALVRNTRHIGDFTNWPDASAFQKSFDRVLRDLRAMP